MLMQMAVQTANRLIRKNPQTKCAGTDEPVTAGTNEKSFLFKLLCSFPAPSKNAAAYEVFYTSSVIASVIFISEVFRHSLASAELCAPSLFST